MPDAAARARLIDLVAARSYESGREITLASGRVSTIYFNLKPTMLHAEAATLIAEATLDLIAQDGASHAGGLEMGAVPLAANLAQASYRRGAPIAAFFVRKQAKTHGAQLLIEGLAPGELLAGARVVVLEDVTTTGGSAMKAIEQVTAAGAQVTRVVTVVDRQEGAVETFAAAGVPFTPILTAADFAGR